MYIQSNQGELNKTDWKQIGIKAAMMAGAVVLPFLAEQLRLVDFGQYQSMVAGIIFMLIYAGNRLNQGN